MSLTASEQQDPSQDTVQPSEESKAKFNLDGSARPFPGATVVCHLPTTGIKSAMYNAIIDHCYDTTTNPVLRDHYVQLPAPSLHMTLLDTIVYPPSTPESTRTADLLRFRRAFLDPATQSVLRAHIPIRMKIDPSPTHHAEIGATLKVPLQPCDATEAHKLLTIRNTLSAAFDRPLPDPHFPFHVTAYYATRPVSAAQFAVLRREWADANTRIAETVPEFEIERVELCVFEDMCHFEVKEFV